jgi:hypothetical protein
MNFMSRKMRVKHIFLDIKVSKSKFVTKFIFLIKKTAPGGAADSGRKRLLMHKHQSKTADSFYD